MFGSKSSDSSKRSNNSSNSNNNNDSHLPLLGSDKKNDDHENNEYDHENHENEKEKEKEREKKEKKERLFVRIKSGDSGETEIDITVSDTVDDLKMKLISKLNITGKRIRLIASGRLLEPASKTLLADFKIQSGAFLHMVITDSQIAPSPASVPGNYLGIVPGAGNVPGVTSFRGLDQLSAAGMTADEIAAVRSSFVHTIDLYGSRHHIERTADETPITFRFRLEETWMDAQGAESEFMMNLPPAAARFRLQGGPNSARGIFGAMNSAPISRTDYNLSEEESSVGTHRDFMWGIVMGYFLGGIMLFCLWDRNFSHKQKVGILIGVTLQIFSGVIRGTGEAVPTAVIAGAGAVSTDINRVANVTTASITTINNLSQLNNLSGSSTGLFNGTTLITRSTLSTLSTLSSLSTANTLSTLGGLGTLSSLGNSNTVSGMGGVGGLGGMGGISELGLGGTGGVGVGADISLQGGTGSGGGGCAGGVRLLHSSYLQDLWAMIRGEGHGLVDSHTDARTDTQTDTRTDARADTQTHGHLRGH